MATQSLVLSAPTALVTLLQSSTGFCAPGGTGIPVYDGPVVDGSSGRQYLVVGWDGDSQGNGQYADEQQQWASIGARKKDVSGSIVCTLWAMPVNTSDMSYSGARASAETVLQLFGDAVRNTSSGVTLNSATGILWTEIKTVAGQQLASKLGPLVIVTFELGYTGRF